MPKESNIAISQIDDVQLAIIETIGEDAFDKLCNAVGGQMIFFVTMKGLTRASRNKSICEKYEAGATYAQLAATYRLTERYVCKIIKQMSSDKQKSRQTVSQLGRLQLDMIEAIGMDSFTKLVERFGGCSVYLSIGERVKIPSRNKEIIVHFKCGDTYAQIAREYRLTERYVREIVSQHNVGDGSG